MATDDPRRWAAPWQPKLETSLPRGLSPFPSIFLLAKFKTMPVEQLDLHGVIAFDGAKRNGLHFHPDGQHLVYALGKKVTIKNVTTGEEQLLAGHTRDISALCVSPSGNLLASGQVNHLGYKAMVIVWKYEERTMKATYEIHNARVEALSFSCRGSYLISLGGRDDGMLVVWDVQRNEPVCERPAASRESFPSPSRLRRMNLQDDAFLTGGEGVLTVWRVDPAARKIHGTDVSLGKLKRTINCLSIDRMDRDVYCGTASGDIIRARLSPERAPQIIGCYSKRRRREVSGVVEGGNNIGEVELYAGGVCQLLHLSSERILVGSGNGTVEMIEITDISPANRRVNSRRSSPLIRSLKTKDVCAAVTSLVPYKDDSVLIGTASCEIYQIRLSDFDKRLLVACHKGTILALAFPRKHAEILVTGGEGCVRLWQLERRTELLRITVGMFICTGLCISRDDCIIFSGWNDGSIRAFVARTGQLSFAIHNAHPKAISALEMAKTTTPLTDAITLITGGCDGQVRIWEVKSRDWRLLKVLKEHRGPVTSLSASNDENYVVSASTDGTCIVWDMTRQLRKLMLMARTTLTGARFSPNAVHVISCGTNGKIAYWEVLDGSLIREIDVPGNGATASLHCLAISPDGRLFVTGGTDSVLRLWDYHGANIARIGTHHAAAITRCEFSPDGKYIVTTGVDGAIMIWNTPTSI